LVGEPVIDLAGGQTALSTRSSRPCADERLSKQQFGDAKPNAGPARRVLA